MANKKNSRLLLSNFILGNAGGIVNSDEQDIGGVAAPRGVRVPGGTKRPGPAKGQAPVIYPRRPSKDAIKRGRAPKPPKKNNFAV